MSDRIDKNYVLNNIDAILNNHKMVDTLEDVVRENISKRIGTYISEAVVRNICNCRINIFNQDVEDKIVNQIQSYLIDKFGTLEQALVYIKLPILCRYWKVEDNKVELYHSKYNEREIVYILKYILTGILDEDYGVIYKENEDAIEFIRKELGLKSFIIGGYTISIRTYKNGKVIIKGFNSEQLNRLNSIINFINDNELVFRHLGK
jgi:hypothetical protein